MWICPYCNQLVPNPVNRKCPNGHGLFDGQIFSFTDEQSAAKAFLNAFLVCLGIFVAVTGINALIPSHPLGKNAAGYPLVIFIVAGIMRSAPRPEVEASGRPGRAPRPACRRHGPCLSPRRRRAFRRRHRPRPDPLILRNFISPDFGISSASNTVTSIRLLPFRLSRSACRARHSSKIFRTVRPLPKPFLPVSSDSMSHDRRSARRART